jgi:protein SCO1/2
MLLILSLSSACGFAGGDDSAARRERETGFRGILLPTPIAKADFTLMDTEYRPFRFREETDGHLTLLFFGYTNCPDICPVHMANLGAVLEDFPYAQRSRVKVVFVTTDPERDTPERLRAWLDDINASFIGLVGPLDEVNRIQQAFNLPAAIRDPVTREKGDYLVGHSAQLLAFTPDNVGRVTYPFGTRQADWLQDLPRLLEHDWTQR